MADTDELDDLFEKSLGDFDGVMEGERSGMASTGSGSGGSARQRETGDAKSVSDAAGRGGYGGPAAGGGMADIPGDGGMSGGDSGGAAGGSSADSGAEEGGGGMKGAEGEFEGGDLDESDRDGAMVGDIPEDIPADGSGDDQVARQIREAAMAEQDPDIQEALWDEYRKQMGIKK